MNIYYYFYNFDSANSDTYFTFYYHNNPDYLKLEGIINYEEYAPVAGVTNKGKDYRIKSRESSYKGSVGW